jgi:hypothetical protein
MVTTLERAARAVQIFLGQQRPLPRVDVEDALTLTKGTEV